MKRKRHSHLLRGYESIYSALSRLLIFRLSAQRAHSALIDLMRRLDHLSFAVRLARRLHDASFESTPIDVGGTQLSHPLILAAGLVKGDGFPDESAALRAVNDTKGNIIPGWRIIPALVGPVEFGSFTRHPRLGNSGPVVWRHANSRSTQNRVGLKNPGARAAAQFLGQRKDQLPAQFGINIAVSPGVRDIETGAKEVVEALEFFLDAGILPGWFTLNLSCPNTEDDPLNYQLEDETRQYCSIFMDCLATRSLDLPLWVKISPGLVEAQYRSLIRIFHKVGVRAVVATNTLPQSSPADHTQIAGAGGGMLFEPALDAIRHLRSAALELHYDGDLIACGGILDGASWRDYRDLGVEAAQYWSALVYRGPLAAALIESEVSLHEIEYETIHRKSLA